VGKVAEMSCAAGTSSQAAVRSTRSVTERRWCKRASSSAAPLLPEGENGVECDEDNDEDRVDVVVERELEHDIWLE